MGQLERPDVVYANTALVASGILAILCRVRRIPVITSIQDLYPDSLVSQGRSRSSGAVIRLLRWMDSWILSQSAALITISERFATVLRDRSAGKLPPIHVIPNWVAPETVELSVDASASRARWGIPAAARLFVYAGNIGAASGIEDVTQAMGLLPKTAGAYLLVAGHGSRLEGCQALAAKISPERIRFHSPWPTEETSLVLRAADVLLLPTKGNQSLVSLPSKMLTYMLAARPILALARPESDLATALDRAGCGWHIPPDEPRVLAEKIRQLTALPAATLDQMGGAGRSYVSRHHDPKNCISCLVRIILDCGARPDPGPASN
jgi:glycosyltransferase involved in cell wall biosynthesis